jgi:ABC-type Fe3+ transport system substrate-binding protein
MARLLDFSTAALICAAAGLLAAGCAPAAPPASPTATPAAKPTEAAAPKPLATTAAQPTMPLAPAEAKPTVATTSAKLAEYYQAAKASGELKIVHYGPGPEYQPLVEEFRKTYPDVQVELVSLRGTETYQRLQAEAASGKRIANVVSGGQTSQTQMEKEGLFAKWEGPPNAANLPPTVPPSDTRYSITYNVFGYVVNTNAVPADKMPQTRQDLLDPFWKGKGKILFEDPRAGGPGIDFFTVTYDQLGKDWMEKVKAQEPTFVRDRDAAPAQIARGEYDAFFPVNINSELFELEKSGPVKLGWFKDGGTTVGMNGIGVIKDAPGQDAAKLWASWWCSPEGQTAISQKSQIYPILPGISPPPGWPRLEDINPQRRTADQTVKSNEYSAIFDQIFFK